MTKECEFLWVFFFFKDKKEEKKKKKTLFCIAVTEEKQTAKHALQAEWKKKKNFLSCRKQQTTRLVFLQKATLFETVFSKNTKTFATTNTQNVAEILLFWRKISKIRKQELQHIP